jgi:hypothetical protein
MPNNNRKKTSGEGQVRLNNHSVGLPGWVASNDRRGSGSPGGEAWFRPLAPALPCARMARRVPAARGSATPAWASRAWAALAWAAIAEACLSGVAILWNISPSARQSAAYGPMPSQVMLAVSMLLTAAGAGAVLLGPRLNRPARLALTVVLAGTAGGVLPLALAALLPAKPGGYGLLLILAVIGMAGVARHIPRTTHPPST